MKKIILLGDSIRQIGYGPLVPGLLGDGYEVWQPSDNCRFAVYTLRALLHDWRDSVRGADVIHFNNGLWDVQRGYDGLPLSPLEGYVATMSRIADLLLANGKTVIFATTTPVTGVHPDIANADIERYNAALVPVLTSKGILVNDLHALIAADVDRYVRKDDNIHLTEDGNRVSAHAVADAIRRVC